VKVHYGVEECLTLKISGGEGETINAKQLGYRPLHLDVEHLGGLGQN
jgi:hypothetical protein